MVPPKLVYQSQSLKPPSPKSEWIAVQGLGSINAVRTAFQTDVSFGALIVFNTSFDGKNYFSV
jgi:hypothetical protein